MNREIRDGLAEKLKEIGFKSDWEKNVHVIDYLAIADWILERDKSRDQAICKAINNIGEAIDHVLDPSRVANIENLLPCCISRLKSARKSLSNLNKQDGA